MGGTGHLSNRSLQTLIKNLTTDVPRQDLKARVNAHRKWQHVIVENDSTLVGCQSALLLSSL